MVKVTEWCCSLQEVDAFAQQFVSVVQRLPSCISTLQALSRLPLPPTLSELQQFLLTADAKFQHLRRSDWQHFIISSSLS